MQHTALVGVALGVAERRVRLRRHCKNCGSYATQVFAAASQRGRDEIIANINENANNNAGSSGSLVLIRLWQQQQQPAGAARSSLLLNRERWNLLRAIASRPPARPSGREHRAPLATGGLTNPFPTRTSSRGSSRASHTSLDSTRHPSRSGHPCARAGSSHHVVEALQPGQGPDCHPQRAQQPQGP